MSFPTHLVPPHAKPVLKAVCRLSSSQATSFDNNDGGHISSAPSHELVITGGCGSQLHVDVERHFPKPTSSSSTLIHYPLLNPSCSPIQVPHGHLDFPNIPRSTTFQSSLQIAGRKRKSPVEPLFKTVPGQIRLLTEAERRQQQRQQQACAVDAQRYSPQAQKIPGVSSTEETMPVALPKIVLTTPWGISFVICAPRPPRRLHFAPDHRWMLELTPKAQQEWEESRHF